MRLACVAVIGLLAGCQEGISIDASESNFCDELAEVACHNMYQCCSEAQIENELGVSEPRTEAQCREDKKRLCIRSSASLRDSLAAGRVELKADALNACLDAMLAPDGTCSTYVAELPWLEACKQQAWVGKVAAGGACFFDHDCAGAPKNAECGGRPEVRGVAGPRVAVLERHDVRGGLLLRPRQRLRAEARRERAVHEQRRVPGEPVLRHGCDADADLYRPQAGWRSVHERLRLRLG